MLIIYIILSILISRFILRSNIFNIASFSLIIYWATYPLERLSVGDDQYGFLYQTINGIKERGIFLYAIFGFTFLLGVFTITKINPKKFIIFPTINSKNNLFFVSIFLGLLGLFCFSYTYNFNILKYLDLTLGIDPNGLVKLSRSERMSLLSTAKNALPYSIFFIPSITTLIISVKKFGLKKLNNIFISFLIFLINIPILFSYIIEGDRTSIIKFLSVVFFTILLTKSSVYETNKNSYLIKNYRLNKKVLINRIKILTILFSLFCLLIFIGLGRGNGWKSTSRILTNLSKQYENKILPTAEFRSVNYSIDFALARDYLSNQKVEKMFTWDKLIFYPLPTYVYKGIFKEKKPPNIGDAIGLENKNYVYGHKDNRKLGFGLSPIAEGWINFKYLGVSITGLIYGISIGLLQSVYNKISLDKINLLDIFILNSLGIVPLIMRVGTAGIYNWIFSTSFVIFLPILLISILQRKKYLRNIKTEIAKK